MRTQYRIDRFQQTYFVIDDFEQLFAATRPDFAPIYREIARLPEIPPRDAARWAGRADARTIAARPAAGKKEGPRVSTARV